MAYLWIHHQWPSPCLADNDSIFYTDGVSRKTCYSPRADLQAANSVQKGAKNCIMRGSVGRDASTAREYCFEFSLLLPQGAIIAELLLQSFGGTS